MGANQLVVPALMLSSLSVVLLFFRMVYLESGRFSFMAWNLALAWIQLGIGVGLLQFVRRWGWFQWQTVVLGLLWLGFLPNSFYLVTDFIHLRNSQPATFLYDAVMCASFALSGLILGCISLYIIQKELLNKRSYKVAWWITLSILLLASFAMYLGRYLGWNSWDLLANPFYILFDLASRFTNREDLSATMTTTLLFFVFNAAIYATFYVGVENSNVRK